jgi:uncharacterized protein with HEPN domain
MIEAAEAVEGFVAGRNRMDFDTDLMLQFAVVRGIEIIGEAASKISTETRALLSAVPWKEIVATRNRLIHGYFDIDHGILWLTATEEIPALLVELRNTGG